MDDSSDEDSSDSEADDLETSPSGFDDGSDSDEEDSLREDEEALPQTPVAKGRRPVATAIRSAPLPLPRLRSSTRRSQAISRQ